MSISFHLGNASICVCSERKKIPSGQKGHHCCWRSTPRLYILLGGILPKLAIIVALNILNKYIEVTW